ncbi:Retrovirus-related Pol polyprotein from transposon [Taenia solium]
MSRWKGRKEEEERGNPTKLVAALEDLPPFKDDMDFEDWMQTTRFYIHSYPQHPPFILDTDASDVAVGGVLSQRDKEGREHVIAYASTRLNKKLRQKSATERELFAIFTMVRHFKHCLIAKHFIVRTDHQALTWLRTVKEIDRCVARWYEDLQQYDFTVQYRRGTMHGNADALSGRPLSAERESGIVGTLFF